VVGFVVIIHNTAVELGFGIVPFICSSCHLNIQLPAWLCCRPSHPGNYLFMGILAARIFQENGRIKVRGNCIERQGENSGYRKAPPKSLSCTNDANRNTR